MENKTVLVIEDNEMNMKLVRELLKIGNYQVLEAVDAESGIQLAREHMPYLILMDIQLPGMDGLSATRTIKADPALKAIPVVALTSYAMEGDKDKAMAAGCSDYFTKPLDTRNFLKKLAKVKRTESIKRESKTGIYKERVLIVDDKRLNVKLLTVMLSGDKYEIAHAFSGYEALEKVAAKTPDLILLDIMMPGLNGYEVTRKLKQNPKTRNIPIILVTALSGTEDKVKGLEAGADEFLTKPVNKDELRTRVKSLIRLNKCREQLTTRTQSKQLFISPEEQSESQKETPAEHSILLVDDNKKDIKLIQGLLAEEPYHINIARNGEEAISIVRHKEVDLILLDIMMPDLNGFEVCRQLKRMDCAKNVQIIILSCLSDVDSKIRGIELGADDFLVKPVNRKELKARINALLKKKTYVDGLSDRFESVLQDAVTDILTGLYNHSYFKHFLDIDIKRSRKQKQSLALLMIDLDDFKQYNDTWGHLAGDKVLKEFGQLVMANTREVDLAARYGGEEFAVVLPYADRDAVINVAERIRQAAENGPRLSDGSLPTGIVTVSIGIAFYPWDANNIEEMIQKADRAMYRAKSAGKNRVCVYDTFNDFR